MKKVIALLAVCGFALAFVACGKKAEESATTVDSAANKVEEVVADSAADSTAAVAPVDSAAH